MSEFKVGDKVVARSGAFPWWFTVNKEYTVVDVDEDWDDVAIVRDDEGCLMPARESYGFVKVADTPDPTREKVLEHIREHLMTPTRTTFYSGYDAALTDLLAGVFSLKFVTKTVTTSEFKPI